jgi:hypothetical protein
MPLPPNGPVTAADYATQRPGTVFPAATRSAATYDSQIYDALGRNGLQLVIDTNSGAGNVTVSILARDPATGEFVAYAEATTAALAGVGQTIFTLRPGLEEDVNVNVPLALPNQFKIRAVVAAADLDFSVGGTLLP